MSDRPSLRHGLPYGWWKSASLWVALASAAIFIGLLTFLVNVYLYG